MKLYTCSYISIYIIVYIAYIYSENVSCLFYIKISTVLITVQIPFYPFCTVGCTGDLVLLLDDRKGSILFFASWFFMAPGFLGVQKGSRVAMAGPPAAPSAASHNHSRAGWRRAPAGGGGRAERREFSGLLLSVLVSPPCFPKESSGAKPPPDPLSLPAFLLLLSFLNKNQVSPQRVPLPQVPHADHCAQLRLPHPLAPSPGADRCFSGGTSSLARPAPPQFSDRVQDFVGLFSFLPADVAQSPLSKVCDLKQLLLLSVSHWCGSLCTVKRPTSGC